MDTRSKDSIRNIEKIVAAQELEIAALKESIATLTQLARDIKRSVVRKYKGSKDES